MGFLGFLSKIELNILCIIHIGGAGGGGDHGGKFESFVKGRVLPNRRFVMLIISIYRS